MKLNDLFNLKKYDESVTDEILAIKNRVRNLIRNSHWQKEGEYKEAILRKIIDRNLPKKYSVGTGFILGKKMNKPACSRQIDIMIFDSNNYPTLLKEGDDFYIVEPDSVRAIIEVKTKLESTKLINAIVRMNEIGQFVYYNSNEFREDLFVGIFSFEGYDFENYDEENIKIVKEKVYKLLQNEKLLGNIKKSYRGDGHSNYIVLNKDIFILRQFAYYTYQMKLNNNLVYSDFINYLQTFLINYRKGDYEPRRKFDSGNTLFELRMRDLIE